MSKDANACLGEPWARGPGESTTARDGLPDARLLALVCLGWVVGRKVSFAFLKGGEGVHVHRNQSHRRSSFISTPKFSRASLSRRARAAASSPTR